MGELSQTSTKCTNINYDRVKIKLCALIVDLFSVSFWIEMSAIINLKSKLKETMLSNLNFIEGFLKVTKNINDEEFEFL